MKCGDCRQKLTEDSGHHRIVSYEMNGPWKGKDWSLNLCDKCNDKFEKKIGR